MSNAHDLAAELVARINARRVSLIESLSDGQCQDWAHYQRQVGLLEGLKQVLEIIPDSVTKVTGGQ